MVQAAVGSRTGLARAPSTLVVIIAIPGLQWSDLAAMPTVARLAQTGAVGQLSVKTNGPTTRCLAGSLALGAGNRTVARPSGCRVSAPVYRGLVASNAHSRYAANLPALTAALDKAGVRRVAVSMEAEFLASADGQVPLAAGPGSAPRRSVVGDVDSGLYEPVGPRSAAAAMVDRQVSDLLRAVGGSPTVMIVASSDGASGPAHLRPLVITGPGWPHRELTSGTTDRAPYVQLIDVAPTVLSVLGVPVPAAMVGRPARVTSASVQPVAHYADQDRHARAAPSLALRGTLTWLTFALVMLLVLKARPARPVALGLAGLLAPAFAMSLLLNALPWWRWSHLLFGVLLLVGCAVVAAAQAAFRRHRGLPVALALTAVVLGVDQLTGSDLQLSAPLGDDPLSAGRFHGMGNLAFAAFGAAMLLLAGLVAARLGRRNGVLAAAAICLAAIVVDGAPSLGDDLGGVLALVPASLVLLGVVAGFRFTWWRAVTVAVVAVVVAVGLALADYARPASQQTHVGRFVGRVLHGGAGVEVHRKFDSAVGSIGPNAATILVAVVLVIVAICRNEIARYVRGVPGLSAGVVAAVVLAVVGSALNDSGIAVAAMTLTVGISGIVASDWSGLARGRSPLPAPTDPATAHGGDPLPA